MFFQGTFVSFFGEIIFHIDKFSPKVPAAAHCKAGLSASLAFRKLSCRRLGWTTDHHPPITSWWFFTNPSEKYARQNGFIFPNFRGEHKKYLKPPPRLPLLLGSQGESLEGHDPGGEWDFASQKTGWKARVYCFIWLWRAKIRKKNARKIRKTSLKLNESR